MASGVNLGIWFYKVIGVAVYSKDHVSGSVSNGSIQMRVQVVQEICDGILCLIGWCVLFGSDISEVENNGHTY